MVGHSGVEGTEESERCQHHHHHHHHHEKELDEASKVQIEIENQEIKVAYSQAKDATDKFMEMTGDDQRSSIRKLLTGIQGQSKEGKEFIEELANGAR